MATTTFSANKDARLANNGSNMGAGASDYLPVGLYTGFLYRSIIGFSYSFSGMTSISSAILHLKTSSQHYVAFGSDPDVTVRRITANWSEGTAVSLSGSNAVVYPGPAATNTNSATFDVSTAENTWDTVDITAMMQDALAAGVFYGVQLRAVDEGSATDVTEFYAREYGSNDAYISVTYSTQTVPSAPTINSPTAGEIVTSTTPTISITHSDPQGDAAVSFDMEVDAVAGNGVAADWASLAWSTYTDTSDLTNPITKVTGALSRGQWYALRARTADSLGYGAWSATRWFKVGSLATATVTVPTNGHTAKVYYDSGSNTTPHFEVTWSFSDSDSHTQASASIKVYADSAGSPGSLLHTHAHTGALTTAKLTGYTPANGTYYHISVTPTCTLMAGTESTKNRTRVRWGRASYYYDMTTAPVLFGAPAYNVSLPANTAVTVEYATTASTTEPTTWYSTLAAAGAPARYVWHRATLMGWGSATPTSPSLLDLTLSYDNNVIAPDYWDFSDSQSTIDTSTFLQGTRCLKERGTGAAHETIQDITGLVPGLTYILSAAIKAEGAADAYFYFADAGFNVLATIDANINATQDFTRVSTNPFVATTTSGYISMVMEGDTGTFAWFDAVKLEPSTISTPWSPGFISGGVSVDSGGLQVDGTEGGLLRLRGSGGSALNVVELGARGRVEGGVIEYGAVEITATTGSTVYFADADLPRIGAALFTDDGDTGAGIVSWFRDGTYNRCWGIGVNSGLYEFRGTTFSGGSGGFSWFVESNSTGARVGIKNNAGYQRTFYLMLFGGAGW